MTIAATAITIDGPTAWLVVRNHDGWFWETDHNRPCDTCDGTGHATFGNQVRTSEECHDCDGSKQHTFNIHLSEGQHETLSVHVVEVLPIYGKTQPPTEVRRFIAKWRETEWVIADRDANTGRTIPLSADAAAGKYVVRMEVHS
jgi:DnaJ-class molecular chaperone